jgi:hypothetical protein
MSNQTKPSRRWKDSAADMAEYVKENTVCRSKLPLDPDDQNDDRAEWAEAALVTLMEQTGADADTALPDLLCDLMHWCDRRGLNFDEQLKWARGNYKEKTTKES